MILADISLCQKGTGAVNPGANARIQESFIPAGQGEASRRGVPDDGGM